MLSPQHSLTITPTRQSKATVSRKVFDIHPKIASFVVDSSERYGMTRDDVGELLGMDDVQLTAHMNTMSWNSFATLLNTYSTTQPHKQFVDEFWLSFTRQPINNHVMKIFRNIASPEKLYHILDRYLGPRMLPCLQGTSHVNEQGILIDEIVHRYPEGAVPCPIYFHLVIESLRVAPVMMMGLQPAVLLDFETDGLSARYTLRPPPSRSILRRIRDATKIFMGARSLFDLLENHQNEQHQTFEQLKSMNEELENRVSQRTRELAEINHNLAIARDQAERESESKSRYLASMSHEIRTPLSAIIGYAELLEEDAIDQVDEQSAEDLRSITASAKHLLALIGDILDLSKIEANKLSIVKSTFSVQQALEDLITSVKPMAQAHHNVIKLHMDVCSTIKVHTDEMRLKQIMLNLLSNAIKFTSYGKIFLTVTSDDTSLLISVKDTGIGMNEEELSRIFTPFEQAKSCTQNKHGGTGLGMAISRELSEVLGGSLTVQSTQGQGSTFTVALPLSLCDMTP